MGRERNGGAGVRKLKIQPEVEWETGTYICSVAPGQFSPRLTKCETVPKKKGRSALDMG